MGRQLVHVPRDEDADDREWRVQTATVVLGVGLLDAGENADVDEYQLPLLDDCGDGTEDYWSERKWRR